MIKILLFLIFFSSIFVNAKFVHPIRSTEPPRETISPSDNSLETEYDIDEILNIIDENFHHTDQEINLINQRLNLQSDIIQNLILKNK